MASTIDCSLIREPQLLDLIDEEWARDKLPDDGGCCAMRCLQMLLGAGRQGPL